jgi:aminoglycoside phosphotransferase (APT) family kinase protein
MRGNITKSLRLLSENNNRPYLVTQEISFFSSLEFLHAIGDFICMMNTVQESLVAIDEALVGQLLEQQFPQWSNLPVVKVVPGGWDNRTFRLGTELLVRFPSAQRYVAQVEKEQNWLPKLAPFLLLPIPAPIAMGQPGCGFPWVWSVYQWLEGVTVEHARIKDSNRLAFQLARFLRSLHKIDASSGPRPGQHNFHRGGDLTVYADEARAAIAQLGKMIDGQACTALLEDALASQWENPPVWVHGDVAPANLLTINGELSAVIDFGSAAVGDPSCDLAMAWTYFDKSGREVFRRELGLDDASWTRGKGWALWKALISMSGNSPNQQTMSYAQTALQALMVKD